jgi:hypothetical protein
MAVKFNDPLSFTNARFKVHSHILLRLSARDRGNTLNEVEDRRWRLPSSPRTVAMTLAVSGSVD